MVAAKARPRVATCQCSAVDLIVSGEHRWSRDSSSSLTALRTGQQVDKCPKKRCPTISCLLDPETPMKQGDLGLTEPAKLRILSTCVNLANPYFIENVVDTQSASVNQLSTFCQPSVTPKSCLVISYDSPVELRHSIGLKRCPTHRSRYCFSPRSNS